MTVEILRGRPDVHAPIVVLLVDDQRFVAVAVQRLLSTEPDIVFHHCQNAVDAVARANEIKPAVILQDLLLPDIDGLTMVGLFRANPQTRDTAILALSGNDDVETRARALAAGATDYLVKLPTKNDLVACIRRHACAAGAVTAGAETALSPPSAVAPDHAKNETLDGRAIAEFRTAMDDPDFIVMLIETFITDATLHVATLKDASQHQDTHVLRTTAHSLKGSSMTIGAKYLAALCAQIEMHADSDPGGAVTSALVTELDPELLKVCRALEAERQPASRT